jgi:hypothetical protein
MAEKYRLVPDHELARLQHAARALIEQINRLNHMAGEVIIPGYGSGRAAIASEPTPAPVAPPSPLPPPVQPRSESDTTAAAQKTIERARATGERHRPKIFAKNEPKIADFVFLLMGSTRFSVEDARQELAPIVMLHPLKARSQGQIRTALERDHRFTRVSPGIYMKRPERG